MWWLTSFGVSVAGGVLPGFATEVWLVGVGVVLGPAAAAALVVVTTMGQVIGKLIVYGAAERGAAVARATGFDLERARSAVAGAGAFLPLLIFTSALSSMPPWHLTTVACGIGRSGALSFAAAGFAGRVVRSSILVFLPRLALEVMR
jgi:hypothetical protein